MDRRRYSFGASAPKEPLRPQQGLSPPSFCLLIWTIGEAVPVVGGGYLRTAGWRRAGGRREPPPIERVWKWNKVEESSRTAGRLGEDYGPVFLEEDNVHFCDGIGGLPVFYFEDEVFADRYCTVGGDRHTGKRC